MPGMTEEEADALDELVTKNPPRVDLSRARHAVRMVAVDDLSADYLMTRALSDHKTPDQIISEMVHERIAAAL